MSRIIIRLLIAFALLVNLVILILSYLLNVNIYKEYGKLILKMTGIFILVVLAFYVALAFIGIK